MKTKYASEEERIRLDTHGYEIFYSAGEFVYKKPVDEDVEIMNVLGIDPVLGII